MRWGHLGLVLGMLPEAPSRARALALEHGVEEVRSEARQLGLYALLSFYLPDLFPLQASDRYRDLFLAASLERGTVRVQSILADAGVRSLVFKGLAVAAKYYPHAWLRPSSDIDIIVCPGDMRRAVCALSDAGWQIVQDLPATRLEFSNHMVLVNRRRQTLELHYAPIADFQAGVDVEALFARAERIALSGGGSVTAPGEADHFVLLAAHLIHHVLAGGLKWLFDLKLMLRSVDGWDWNAVVESARAKGLSSATGIALRELHPLEAGVPAWVLDALGPGMVRRELVEAVRRRGGPDLSALFSSVVLADRVSTSLVIEAASRPVGRVLARNGLGPFAKSWGRRVGRNWGWIRARAGPLGRAGEIDRSATECTKC